MEIKQSQYGTIEEQQIYKFTFENNYGTKVSVINYGGIITEMITLDKNQIPSNIVLGYDNLDKYHNENSAYFGAIVGRNCNRIAQGRFTLPNDNNIYQLAINNGPNHLHGGINGFDKKIYNYEIIQPNKLILKSQSNDNEEGYPGKLEIKIIYELSQIENKFIMTFECQSDKQTICNLTSHGYFNLQTEKNNINCMKDHYVQLNSNLYNPIDNTCIPTGEIHSVKDTPFDFTQLKQISLALNDIDKNQQLKIGKGIDHNFIINKKNEEQISLVGIIIEQNSGRKLEIFSNQIGCQFYTGNYLGNIHGFIDNCAFCLETQAIPNSINTPHFPSTILLPNQVYTHQTVYQFGVQQN